MTESTELVPAEPTEEDEVEHAGESVADYWVPPNLPKHFLSTRDNRTLVSFAGLIYMLHLATMGEFECVNEVVQRGNKDNGDETIVRCTITGSRRLEGSKEKVPFKVVCEGDAGPGNVTNMIAPHKRRMAETRAMARAMRVATNVGLTAADELGPSSGRAPARAAEKSYPQRVSRDYGPAAQRAQNAQEAPPIAGDDAPPPEPEEAPASPDVIIVQGKRYTRAQVVAAMRKRIEEANRIGIKDYQRVGEDAPLGEIVGFTQRLRKRIVEAPEKEDAGEQAPPAE